jgi:hypothetical protein
MIILGETQRDLPVFVAYSAVRIPDWKRQMEKAMRELDPALLVTRVHDAEWAIYLRWQELAILGGDQSEERAELAAAVEDLLSIKTYKLGWPGSWIAPPRDKISAFAPDADVTMAIQ